MSNHLASVIKPFASKAQQQKLLQLVQAGKFDPNLYNQMEILSTNLELPERLTETHNQGTVKRVHAHEERRR